MRCCAWVVLLAMSAGFVGCSRGESDAQRLSRLVPNARNTTKVTGTVTVDGEPVKDLWVTLHPVDDTVKERPRAQTDAAGQFNIGTYLAKDGAPQGEYKVTVEWLKYIKRDSDWGGPDQLKNQYNNPKTTPFSVTVEADPVEIPTMELNLEGVEGKPDPKKPAGPRDK